MFNIFISEFINEWHNSIPQEKGINLNTPARVILLYKMTCKLSNTPKNREKPIPKR